VRLLLCPDTAVFYQRVHFCLYGSRNREGTTLAVAAGRGASVRDIHSRALARGCCGVFSTRFSPTGGVDSGATLAAPRGCPRLTPRAGGAGRAGTASPRGRPPHPL